MILLFDISCKDLNVFNYFSFIILFNLKKKYKYYIVVEMIVVMVLYKRK